VGVIRAMMSEQYCRWYGCCQGNRRNAELLEFSSSLQGLFTVLSDRSQTNMDGLHCPYLQQHRTSGCVVGATLDRLCFCFEFNELGSACTKPYPSSVLSSSLSIAFGALQLSSIGIEKEITCESESFDSGNSNAISRVDRPVLGPS